MSPEDRDALIEAGYDPDDRAVQYRMLQVERGLKVLRQRWHTQPEVFARPLDGSDTVGAVASTSPRVAGADPTNSTPTVSRPPDGCTG